MFGAFRCGWCVAVWYGVVWHGMVWCGMAWYGMALHGMVWHGMVWHGITWYGMVWYGMVWYGMIWPAPLPPAPLPPAPLPPAPLPPAPLPPAPLPPATLSPASLPSAPSGPLSSLLGTETRLGMSSLSLSDLSVVPGGCVNSLSCRDISSSPLCWRIISSSSDSAVAPAMGSRAWLSGDNVPTSSSCSECMDFGESTTSWSLATTARNSRRVNRRPVVPFASNQERW